MVAHIQASVWFLPVPGPSSGNDKRFFIVLERVMSEMNCLQAPPTGFWFSFHAAPPSSSPPQSSPTLFSDSLVPAYIAKGCIVATEPLMPREGGGGCGGYDMICASNQP